MKQSQAKISLANCFWHSPGFPWMSVTNERFSKWSLQGSLTSHLGIRQPCRMSCQGALSSLHPLSSCSYYSEVGHEHEENFFIQWLIMADQLTYIPGFWRRQKKRKHKVDKMYEHQIVLDTLAAFDLGSHENGMLLHQSREHGLGGGRCYFR